MATVGSLSSVASAPPPLPHAIAGSVRAIDNHYRLSVAQYHAMAEAGILATSDRVELVDGVLVCKMTIYPSHAFATDALATIFKSNEISGWTFRSQLPITLTDGEPEPDGALVRGNRAAYRLTHPQPQQVGLVIEVAESSLMFDRGVKKRSYARAGVPIYWLVNLVDKVVEVYDGPVGDDYSRTIVLHRDDKVPVLLDGETVREVEISSLFG